jgi:uncharacterized membrane protein
MIKNRLNSYYINNKKFTFLYLGLLLLSVIVLIFVNYNHKFYTEIIAKVDSVVEEKSYDKEDITGKKEIIYEQKINAIIMNGQYKNNQIKLENTASYSGAYDIRYKKGDEIFVSVSSTKDSEGYYSGEIEGVKRDKYVISISLVFILLIILVGKLKGLLSLFSVIINILIFSFTIDLYLRGVNLILASSIACILFIILSLSLVSGINRKTFSAIVGTIIGTIISILIALIVIKITNGQGIRYEEMQFLTKPPGEIFIAQILVGSLGAIMDICITMASSIYELYNKDPKISKKKLIESGIEIGKDITGTMINVLFFVYVSGSIPMILLWLKNGMLFDYVINVNLSLEMIRALTGSIGIVISIPISIYVTVFFINKDKIRRNRL